MGCLSVTFNKKRGVLMRFLVLVIGLYSGLLISAAGSFIAMLRIMDTPGWNVPIVDRVIQSLPELGVIALGLCMSILCMNEMGPPRHRGD